MPEPLIEFRNVYKSFGKNDVLKNINLQIYEDELFGIIGVSGAGKTTLLRALIGFYKIDKGQVFYKGKDIHKNLKEIRRIFGFASQDNCFYYKLKVQENLEYFGRLYGLSSKEIKERSDELLKLVELDKARHRIAGDLSGGMKRRVDLACAMMHNPKILILDEPSEGLDPLLRKHMLELIQKINKRGTTIIICSHLLSEIETICTKIGIINQGTIIEVDSPDKLKELYSRDMEIHLETFPGRYDIITTELKQHPDLTINYVSNQGHKLVIYTPNAEKVLHQILRDLEKWGEQLLDVDVNKPTLSEVFEALTSNEKVEGVDEEKISGYVKQAMEYGYTKTQIMKILSEQRWPQEAIRKALENTEEQK